MCIISNKRVKLTKKLAFYFPTKNKKIHLYVKYLKMSNQRRTFLRNIALTSIGLPLFSNRLLASPKGSLNSLAISNQEKLFKTLDLEGYKVIVEKKFDINKYCKAFPLQKDRFFNTENKLLLVTKDNHFILSEEQQLAYQNFITAYTFNIKSMHTTKNNLIDAMLPVQILASNKSSDFRFKNEAGNIIEIHQSKKGSFVKVV